MVWVKIKLQGRRHLLAAAYYNPHTSDEESQRLFAASARKATTTTNSHLIIGGDSLPAFDWKTTRLKNTNCYPLLHHQFLDTIQELALEQMITEPTREDNTIDLFLTNSPSL